MEETNEYFAILSATTTERDTKIQALADLQEIWHQRLIGQGHALRIIVANLPDDQRKKITAALRECAHGFDQMGGFESTVEALRDVLRGT